MEVLAAIENSGFGTWVRESPSIFAYTGFLTLHAMGLAFAVGFSWVIALRSLGFARSLPLATMENLFPVVWAGFWVNAISGVPLLISNATRDLTNPVFLTKLAFIALAAVTTLRLQRTVFGKQFGQESGHVPQTGGLLAGASAALWAAAIVAGRLSEYPSLFGMPNH